MCERISDPEVGKELMKTADALSALADSLKKLCSVVPESQKETKKIAPAIPLEKVRGVLAEKSRDGFTAEVRAIIQSFHAERLSEIDPKEYEAVIQKAEALGNG